MQFSKSVPKQNKLSQKEFLFIKQRLDYYMLPTSFPLEAASLLLKLLTKLDQNQKICLLSKNQLAKNKKTHVQKKENLIDMALKNQISKLIKSNNILHLETITLKEQIAALNHKYSKLQIKQKSQLKQTQIMNKMHSNKQQILKCQYQQLRFKYNQLMDFIHNDQPKQKEYIKHLLKHKHIDNENFQKIESNNNRPRGISENNRKRQINQDIRTQYEQIQMMKQKISNRQKQIKRLQQKLQFDGLNMNKILKDFQEDLILQKYSQQQSNLENLIEQNKILTQKINKMKRQGGDKQALRQQTKRATQLNRKLQQQNSKIKIKSQQFKFDQEKQRKKLQSKLNRTTKEIKNIVQEKAEQKENNLHNITKINYLQKKIEQLQNLVKKESQNNLKKQIQISILTKKMEGQKLMFQYESQKGKQFQSQYKQLLLKQQKNKINLLQLEKQICMLKKQNELKSVSILNLEAIIQELMKKNQSLNQSTTLLDKTILQTNLDAAKRQISDFKIKLNLCQTSYFQLDRLNQLKQKEYKLLQQDYQNICQLNEQIKKQCQILKEQNTNLNIKILESIKWEQKLSNQRKQKQVTFCLYQKERELSTKQKAQMIQLENNLQRTQRQLNSYKNQLHSILHNQKVKQRDLEKKIAILQQNLLIKNKSLEQKEARMVSLQKDLIQHSQRIREVNKEASILDEQVHKIKIQKTRLERKNSQLTSDLNLLKQKQHKKISLSDVQHKSQIDRLWREKENMKILIQELQRQNIELIKLKKQFELQSIQKTQTNQISLLKIQDMLKKQKLYIMEIQQLKQILNQNKD